ncbi:hypothetical protein ACM39_17695 [Chryseobacterium sp. FH2]|uniref:hypothetical protein n=1 Tax=Chryseobacterium sp. FH2 TaxID=1674291 RepID=UPI00065AE933|nr:hypothetical protein [Chryseobacterium sp. FH2]KMQ62941.1 hypothetical protein ACM39_17695 [Chryseobacterium sp. FH2]
METIEDIFNLIKQTVHLSGKIGDYKIRISKSTFERKHLINIYKIREGIATRQENHKLAKKMHQLLIGLEDYSGDLLKGADIFGDNYFGMFYLSQNWDEVIGYLESETDENGNVINC